MTKVIDFSDNFYQAILFDFDGVLAESMNVKTEAFATLFEEFGKEVVEKVVKHHVKHGGISRYKKMRYYYEKYLNKPLSDKKLNDLAKQFSDLVVEKVIESDWVKGVKDFLEKYYQIIDLYVVSGTPQEELELIVKRRNMEKYFKGVYGSPEVKPTIIRRIISERKYDPDKIIYIGDSMSDYNGAKETEALFLGRVPKNSESPFPENTLIFSDFYEVL